MKFTVKEDGFFGELLRPEQELFPGKALVCFSGSDGNFELAKMLGEIYCRRGLTVLPIAYIKQEGLPSSFDCVPVDVIEAAAKRLHQLGYEKVILWGISMGAELALLAGSLLPGIVNAVIAVSPMHIVTQGFVKGHGVSLVPNAAFGFHGKSLPYTPFGFQKFPLGSVIWKSLKAGEMTMYDLYKPAVDSPVPESVIRVENITGPVLLISSSMDTMWPGSICAEKIVKRLRQKGFPYPFQHLHYGYGSHLFVPMELRMTKFFKAERKYRAESRNARMDSLEKTLAFIRKC